jgi:DNA-binding MarR family transcriptional regulator
VAQEVPPDELEEMARLFRRVARLVFSLKPLSGPGSELPEAQLRCLFAMARQGPCTMSQLSERLQVHPSTATELVERLIQAGLAERQRSEEDRRVVWVGLTAAGRETVAQRRQAFRQHLLSFLERLTAEQRQAMFSALQTLNQIASEAPRKSLSTGLGKAEKEERCDEAGES